MALYKFRIIIIIIIIIIIRRGLHVQFGGCCNSGRSANRSDSDACDRSHANGKAESDRQETANCRDSRCVLWSIYMLYFTFFVFCLQIPQYLSECILPASSRFSGRQLRSTESVSLLVPSTCHTTIGVRAFPVAAAWAWNSLPPRVRAASSIVSFRRELKT